MTKRILNIIMNALEQLTLNFPDEIIQNTSFRICENIKLYLTNLIEKALICTPEIRLKSILNQFLSSTPPIIEIEIEKDVVCNFGAFV